MAEGPAFVLLKERAAVFMGREIERVEGNTPIEKERLLRQRVVGLRSCGKHFLIELGAFSLRVHLLSSAVTASTNARTSPSAWAWASPRATRSTSTAAR